jgi:hypothetical protein
MGLCRLLPLNSVKETDASGTTCHRLSGFFYNNGKPLTLVCHHGSDGGNKLTVTTNSVNKATTIPAATAAAPSGSSYNNENNIDDDNDNANNNNNTTTTPKPTTTTTTTPKPTTTTTLQRQRQRRLQRQDRHFAQ